MRSGWVLALLLAACGRDGQGPESAGLEAGPVPGTVVVDNQTPYALEVAYVDSAAGAVPRIVRTQVEPGQRGQVSAGILPGGWEVEFDLVLLLPVEQGFRVRRKWAVRIDGDLTLRVRLAGEGDPFSVEIEAGV